MSAQEGRTVLVRTNAVIFTHSPWNRLTFWNQRTPW